MNSSKLAWQSYSYSIVIIIHTEIWSQSEKRALLIEEK